MRITPVDESLADDGKWFEYQGVPLKIARTNTNRFKKAYRRLTKPYEKLIRNNRLDPETSERVMSHALAEAVLLDWDPNKMPGNVPYSVENAVQLLTDDVDCREFVAEIAGEAENYYKEEKEAKVESLKKASNGS